MMHNLLVGFGLMVACLLLQAVFVTLCLRRYIKMKVKNHGPESRLEIIALLTITMVLLQISNAVQVTIWAGLFIWLGEFRELPTALYHSWVNYAGLGYGDIVMSEEHRMLGPMETAHGVMMFGISTAIMTAAVMDVLKQHPINSLFGRDKTDA
jgi:hypothetical protein